MKIEQNKLLVLLRKTKNFLQGEGKVTFQDVDSTFYDLFGKVSSFPSPYDEIYSYLDVLIDSKEHEFKSLPRGYTYKNAISDIDFMIKCIELNRVEEDIDTDDFLQRLRMVFK